MPRHRGKFNGDNPEPYELSRSRIEKFVRCKACFFMEQVEGIKFPSIPGFNINEATDILLKRDFDKYRAKKEPHPYLVKAGLEFLIPYEHEHFDLWTQSLHFGAKDRLNYIDVATNLKIGGGLDDVWLNINTNCLHIVDYKSTSQKSDKGPITLNDPWKLAYKRQMDLYAWVLYKKGFPVDGKGYFLYCDADRFSEYSFLNSESANMKFKINLIDYEVNFSWISPTLEQIYDTIRLPERPSHNHLCEYGKFLRDSYHN
jgi:hypothetical protein